ncbi:MAG: zinc ribbon domain-containing protein [Lachnospiraceae bacterium]|nr:zinc ribbon domain-containing protein [Lachnospiraceae bacterium]
MNKKCPNCGNECPVQAAFCGNCGYAFPKHTPIMEMKTEPTPAVAEAAAAQAEAAVAQSTEAAAAQAETTAAQSIEAAAAQTTEEATAATEAGATATETPAMAYGTPVPETAQPEMPLGTPVQELYTPAEAPKKKKKTVLIAVVSLAVIALAIGAFFLIRGIMAKANPDGEDFIEIQRSFIAERFEAEETSERFAGRDGISMDVSLSAEIAGQDEQIQKIQKLLDGSAIIFKIDTTPGRILCNLILNLKGSNVLEGIVTLTENELGFSVPALDDRYFTMDLDFVLANFGDGYEEVFSGGALAVGESVSVEEMTALGRKFRDLLASHISAEALLIEEVKDVRLEGLQQSVSGKMMTWKPTADELEALLLDIADFLEKEETLHKAMDATPFLSMSTGSGAANLLKEAAGDLRKDAKESAKQMAESGFAWSVLTEESGALARIRIETGEVALIFETVEEGNGRKEAYLVTERGARAIAVMHSFQDANDLRSGSLEFSTDFGGVDMRYERGLTKRSVFGAHYGWYDIDLGSIVPGYKMRFEIAEDSTYDAVMTLSMEGLDTVTSGMVEKVKLFLRVKEGSTAKEPEGARTDITNYSQQQMQDLIQKMSNQLIYTLLTSPELMELLGSLYF